MSPKHKSNTTSDSDVLKRSCKNIPLSEKVKVFYLIRKKRNCMQRLLKSRSELICEIVKTEKEIHASFAVAPQTTTFQPEYMISVNGNRINLYIF